MNRCLDYSDLPRILIEALVILSFGVLVGLSLHHQLVRDVLNGKLTAPPVTAAQQDAMLRYPEPVDLQTVQAQSAAGTLLLDARIEELFREGHLPGSVSFPLNEADALLPGLRGNHPVDTPLITYCNGYGCPDSFDLAVRLLEAGYHKVMVFEGGYPEWEGAGLPIERGN